MAAGGSEQDLIDTLVEKVGGVIASEHFMLYKRQLGEYKCISVRTLVRGPAPFLCEARGSRV